MPVAKKAHRPSLNPVEPKLSGQIVQQLAVKGDRTASRLRDSRVGRRRAKRLHEPSAPVQRPSQLLLNSLVARGARMGDRSPSERMRLLRNRRVRRRDLGPSVWSHTSSTLGAQCVHLRLVASQLSATRTPSFTESPSPPRTFNPDEDLLAHLLALNLAGSSDTEMFGPQIGRADRALLFNLPRLAAG